MIFRKIELTIKSNWWSLAFICPGAGGGPGASSGPGAYGGLEARRARVPAEFPAVLSWRARSLVVVFGTQHIRLSQSKL